MAGLLLIDAAIEDAIGHIVAAEHEMLVGRNSRPTGGFESLTGIAAEVDVFLRGVHVGRAALADAAKTTGRGLRTLLHEMSSLDAAHASALDAGFAVPGREA
ncbi:hypothetical protein [Leucobacter sp. gxy201]|uniref:hypothetical protein n=1 Tax=Leucobacter sp. gxy201 TaxID=2957200 RepID=UPI003DA196D9